MGYILDGPQVGALNHITTENELDSIELLWLPWHVRVRIWRKGRCREFKIDHDGNIREAGD